MDIDERGDSDRNDKRKLRKIAAIFELKRKLLLFIFVRFLSSLFHIQVILIIMLYLVKKRDIL